MAKIFKEDGSFYYYYYKKKRGRKKKRGPKKVISVKGSKTRMERWNFKIIRCDDRRQTEYIGTYDTLDDAYVKKDELLLKNDGVQIPVMFINNKRNGNRPYETKSEYIILKKNRSGEKKTSMIRDEYGRIVENETTSDIWYIFEKFPCLVEERFWVYGKNPKRDRFTVIEYEEQYIDAFMAHTDENLMVMLYNNKLIVRYDTGDLSILIAKNIQDGIRVYNHIESRYKGVKRVIMYGFVNGRNEKGKDIIRMVAEKTGWPKDKIYKKTTVY